MECLMRSTAGHRALNPAQLMQSTQRGALDTEHSTRSTQHGAPDRLEQLGWARTKTGTEARTEAGLAWARPVVTFCRSVCLSSRSCAFSVCLSICLSVCLSFFMPSHVFCICH
jgi:hypothetical protein